MAKDNGIDAPVALDSILFTDELNRRPSRPPDYKTENGALVGLAQALADAPRLVLQTLADTILEVLGCDSAGISLLTEDGRRFYWPAIAGVWKPHLGGGTPRDFGPCGDVLDRDIPLLFKRFERRYTYFLPVTPPVEECLLAPFYVEGKPVGTIWAIAHNDRRKFDNEDLRQLVSLSRFASSAYQARAALDTLEESEVRYRRLFEAAHDGILILNTGTRKITEVNPFMLELLDYPREHFIGKELWEIGIFRDKAANQSAMQELHENGSIRFENLPLQDRNGRRHPVEIVANIYQEGPEPVIQCNIRDIGERVRFEREREALLVNEQASRMEAEAANRSKDLFLATLSHEVRTPLNAILGWAAILRSGECSEADRQEGMEVIERNCKAQAQLIEDVLDVSRIVSGKLQLQIRPCELAEVINAAIDVVRPSADAKAVRLEAILDPAASHASCDVNRMQQVVWNLLANAIKFTSHGRTVRVTLAGDRSSARIQVSDQGQGISPGFLPFVFDRFRQADSTTQRKFGGLGLGLSIVKHIVEMHGGTVRAESAGDGQGATFTIDLPVRAVQIDEGNGDAADRSDATSLPEVMPVRLDRLRVMVVDDEPDARRLLVKVLGEAGAIVTARNSVVDAMAALATAHPEVLVSDIAMPDQDGYDLIRQVRSKGLTAKDLPAIALTAFAHKEDRRRALLAGFQLHVPKPIDPHDLTTVIASLAGRTG